MAPDLTFEEARLQLRVSPAHLRRLVRNDLIPHHRVGDLVRFEQARLDAWKAAGGTEAPRRSQRAAGRRRQAAAAGPVAPASRRRGARPAAPADGQGSMSAWAHLVSPDEGGH